MIDTQAYDRGTVIFREGDPADCMYEIESGSIGIYRDYGGKNETRIAELVNNQDIKLFGEMGLLDHAPRSATAVVLEDGTTLTKISEENFFAFFENDPRKVLDILQQMCDRLRKTTRDYVEACQTAYETVEAEKANAEKSQSLLDKIDKFSRIYRDRGFRI